MKEISDAIRQQLFAEPGVNVFAVLDGASVPGLLDKLYDARPQHECLYRGELKPDLAEVAPYLIRLEPESEFTGWVINQGWGNHWGIFVLSQTDFRALRRHFRTFLIVHDAQGKPLYFRYYDPRVLRTYLPSCNDQELETFFGPVAAYVLEAEQPQKLLRFRFASGALVQQEQAISKE